MNIKQIKNIKNQNKIIFLTTNNSTPIKIKRFSFSNSNPNKSRCRNRNIIKDTIINNELSNNSLNNTQKYIFNCYKVSPFIALSIYDKLINKLFEYIKKRLPKNIFLEIKRKYISFVIDELHIKTKNIILNITDQELINTNVKLFTSINNINKKSNTNFAYYNKLNMNSNSLYKFNYNSNSLFKLNKNKSQKSKLLSFNSLKNIDNNKKENKSLINSSNILDHKKKSKNICHTENNQKNNNTNNSNILKPKIIKNKKMEIGKDYFNHIKNLSMINGSSFYNIHMKNIYNKNKKKSNYKQKIINNDKNLLNKNIKISNIIKKNNIAENKQLQNDKTLNNINQNKNKIDNKDNEKNCVHQLNMIKENLEDNLKNMFNFSYGYFLNNERESDSSKSLHDIYKFNNYMNTK